MSESEKVPTDDAIAARSKLRSHLPTAIAALLLIVLLAGCGASDEAAEGTTTAATPTGDEPTELEVETATTTAEEAAQADPDSAGKIIMLKLFVGDVNEAMDFYGSVFGATSAMEMGDGIKIATLPDGPGLVLIAAGDDDSDKYGAFIIQVPDLPAAKAAALDHGATEQESFSGAPGGQDAKSVDLLDPWGNQIEILQLG